MILNGKQFQALASAINGRVQAKLGTDAHILHRLEGGEVITIGQIVEKYYRAHMLANRQWAMDAWTLDGWFVELRLESREIFAAYKAAMDRACDLEFPKGKRLVQLAKEVSEIDPEEDHRERFLRYERKTYWVLTRAGMQLADLVALEVSGQASQAKQARVVMSDSRIGHVLREPRTGRFVSVQQAVAAG